LSAEEFRRPSTRGLGRGCSQLNSSLSFATSVDHPRSFIWRD
jgi:hypothetical protein